MVFEECATDRASLKALRLTCKMASRQTESILFRKLFFRLHPASFNRLKNISENEELRHHVQSIVFIPGTLPHYSNVNEWRAAVRSNACDFSSVNTQSTCSGIPVFNVTGRHKDPSKLQLDGPMPSRPASEQEIFDAYITQTQKQHDILLDPQQCEPIRTSLASFENLRSLEDNGSEGIHVDSRNVNHGLHADSSSQITWFMSLLPPNHLHWNIFHEPYRCWDYPIAPGPPCGPLSADNTPTGNTIINGRLLLMLIPDQAAMSLTTMTLQLNLEAMSIHSVKQSYRDLIDSSDRRMSELHFPNLKYLDLRVMLYQMSMPNKSKLLSQLYSMLIKCNNLETLSLRARNASEVDVDLNEDHLYKLVDKVRHMSELTTLQLECCTSRASLCAIIRHHSTSLRSLKLRRVIMANTFRKEEENQSPWLQTFESFPRMPNLQTLGADDMKELAYRQFSPQGPEEQQTLFKNGLKWVSRSGFEADKRQTMTDYLKYHESDVWQLLRDDLSCFEQED